MATERDPQQPQETPSPFQSLMAAVKEYEDYSARAREAMARMSERSHSLSLVHDEQLKIVANDNGNDEARMRLDQVDREIAALKAEMANQQRSSTAEIRSMRAHILETQEIALRELDRRLKESHTEEQDLKNHRIPDAEKHLSDLAEGLRAKQDESQHLLKQTEEINRLNLEALFQDVETKA